MKLFFPLLKACEILSRWQTSILNNIIYTLVFYIFFKKILYALLLSIINPLLWKNFQLAWFGALESLANEQACIHPSRMDKAVFLNLQNNLGSCFFCHPLYVQIPASIQFLKLDQVMQPISNNMTSWMTSSGQEIGLEKAFAI